MPNPEEYQVEGYGVKQPEYDAPYLDGHDFDPGFVYKYAGNPELQAEYQDGLKAIAAADAASQEEGYNPTPVDPETGVPEGSDATPIDEPAEVKTIPVDETTF